MRLKSTVNEQNLTGFTPEPVTSAIINQRVNSIKYRSSNSRTFNIRKSQTDIQKNLDSIPTQLNRNSIQPENDTLTTNFWPLRPTVTSAQKRPVQEFATKRSQDNQFYRPKSHSMQVRKFKTLKTQNNGKVGRTGDAVTYAK